MPEFSAWGLLRVWVRYRNSPRLKTQDSQANRLCFWAAGDEDSTPKAAEHVEDSRRDVLAFTAFTKEIWTH